MYTGISGDNYGNINSCYNIGNLTISMDNITSLHLAGIGFGGTIVNCYNAGKLYKEKEDETFASEEQRIFISGVGGSKGDSNYNVEEIVVESSIGGYACGISSIPNIRIIDNCYNIGKISTTNSNILIGSLTGWMTNNQITNSKWLKGTADEAIANKGSDVIDGTLMVETIEEMPNILYNRRCFQRRYK